MAFTFSLISLLGILLTLVGLFSLLRKYNYSIGEAFSYGVVIYFSIYSPIIQLLFILRIPKALYIVDAIVIFGSIIIISQDKGSLKSSFLKFINLLRKYKITIPFVILYAYLLLQVLLLPPDSVDGMQYSLVRVLMMQHEGNLFLKNFSEYRQVNYPVGFDILAYVFLRYYSDYFLAIFSFLSYSAILASSYSIVQKFFDNRKLSLTTTIIIGSLIEIILQSTSTKNDLPTAALGTVCFLAAYNYLKAHDLFSLILTITVILLGLTFKSYFMGFAAPFAFYFVICFIYKYSINELISDLWLSAKRYLFFTWIPITIFLCFILFGFTNYMNQGGFFGHPELLEEHLQNDGLAGAGANFVRYFLQALSPPTQLGGKYLNQLHDNLLSAHKRIGAARGLEEEIKLSADGVWPRETSSWFGPLGCFLIIPAVFYSLFKGNMFIRLISLSLLSYFFSISWTIGWMYTYNRFFSLFFAGSGLCVAFFLHKLINSKYYVLLICFSLVVMSYATLANVFKPFFSRSGIRFIISQNLSGRGGSEIKEKGKNIEQRWLVFNWVKYVINRDLYYENNFGQLPLSSFYKLPPHKRVLLLGDWSWIFQYLIRRPDLFVTVANKNRIIYEGRLYNLENRRDYEFIKNIYDYIIFLEVEPIGYMEPERLIVSYKVFSNSTNIYYNIYSLYGMDPTIIINYGNNK